MSLRTVGVQVGCFSSRSKHFLSLLFAASLSVDEGALHRASSSHVTRLELSRQHHDHFGSPFGHSGVRASEGFSETLQHSWLGTKGSGSRPSERRLGADQLRGRTDGTFNELSNQRASGPRGPWAGKMPFKDRLVGQGLLQGKFQEVIHLLVSGTKGLRPPVAEPTAAIQRLWL